MISQEMAVRDLIEECLEAKAAAAQEHNVVLEAELDDPRAIMWGDRKLLRAAVSNLVEMAIRRNRPGGKVIVGYYCDANRESIMVSDDGKGLAFEDLRSVRDIFCRAASAVVYDSEEIDDNLIGFSIVKDIADLHGGRVAVRSIEDEGSTVTLHLPHRHRGVA